MDLFGGKSPGIDASAIDLSREEPSCCEVRTDVASEAKRLRQLVARETERAVELGTGDLFAVEIESELVLIPRQIDGSDLV